MTYPVALVLVSAKECHWYTVKCRVIPGREQRKRQTRRVGPGGKPKRQFTDSSVSEELKHYPLEICTADLLCRISVHTQCDVTGIDQALNCLRLLVNWRKLIIVIIIFGTMCMFLYIYIYIYVNDGIPMDSVLLGYDTFSEDGRFQTNRRNTGSSSWSV
jgi:hypothetical protein